MASQNDPQAGTYDARLRDEFIAGLKRFDAQEYDAAVALFRAADEQAVLNDVFQNRYTSYHGLSRVCAGDLSGVKLCRKAVVGELNDAEVYYNLALAEHCLGLRASASAALRRGLVIQPSHAGLLRLKDRLRLRRQHGLLPVLRRNNLLNRLLAMLVRDPRPLPGPAEAIMQDEGRLKR